MTYGDGWQTPAATPDPIYGHQPTPPYQPPVGQPGDTLPMGMPPVYGYPPQPADPSTYPTQPVYSSPPAYSAPPYSAPPAYGQPGYPYVGPPPPPAPRRSGLIVGIIVLVLLAGAGISGGYLFVAKRKQDTGSQGSTSTTGSTTPPTSGPPTPAYFTGDLRTLLMTPPKTSHPFTDPISKDGTLTKQQVADSFDDPDTVLGVLDQYAWTGGAIVQWHDADDTQVIVKLYQFDTADNANRWLFYNQDGYKHDDSKTDQSPIDGVDGSGLYVANKADDKGYVLTNGVATKGNIYMIVFVWQLDRQNKDAAVNVMQQQYRRLP